MNQANRILLVDDDEKLRRVLSMRLESLGYAVDAVASGEQALDALNNLEPALVLTDLRMPGLDGIELLERIQVLRPGLPVILITAHGDIPDAVRATQAGAVDFLSKPVDPQQLEESLARHARQTTTATNEAWAEHIVTRSRNMLELLDKVKRVARTSSSVLITGPSGAGKELLARALHKASPRQRKEFMALNCGAVPAELLESELFGHKKGAFTGASTDHEGLFRAADGGTVFLDEIGDMPHDLQVKLLRVLQEREVRPVGETRSVRVDVRVLSATHRDLQSLVDEGDFREDLFYRLNVVQLAVPPLDERREDIPLLLAHQLNLLVRKGSPRRVFAPDAVELLVSVPWPGNVRQLFNVVEQCVALSPGRVISLAQVQDALGRKAEVKAVPSFDDARAEFTRKYLSDLLELSEGNVSQAARLAERNRTDFYKLLKKHGIDPGAFKREAAEDRA
ncbi:response regulator GlrR [Oceanococcus atlanticus]|uniref:Response regulator GlrR n=1 Tax=Oceanococcus atlanticus TaxID=1317117 RepID=A0A1Y1SCN7_9GAMM|nr:sigma 54-interacting transcriptional regulator [Oceanococcus atlanticus]ORE86096.1 response regulator GlrR [Oceanococcus atlanticus]RZO86094.1 MAG: response regulator [Oceanococcus sp.]